MILVSGPALALTPLSRPIWRHPWRSNPAQPVHPVTSQRFGLGLYSYPSKSCPGLMLGYFCMLDPNAVKIFMTGPITQAWT